MNVNFWIGFGLCPFILAAIFCIIFMIHLMIADYLEYLLKDYKEVWSNSYSSILFRVEKLEKKLRLDKLKRKLTKNEY